MGHKYFNSIITSHRGRRGSIHAFLRSIFNSSRMVDKDSFEIIIADLDTDPKIGKIVNIYKDSLNIKHLKINYEGLFWKSKALNHCSLNTEGKYITMLDIDAVVPPLFFKEVHKFYNHSDNEKTKLAYRVRFLDTNSSRIVTKNNFDDNIINGLIAKQKKFRQAFERYTANEVKIRNMSGAQKKWVTDQALGNSHYTIRKEDFMAIGGYDERFIGWACEDLDFNRRAFAYLGKGQLLPYPYMTVFSVHHSRTGWMTRKRTTKNENLYKKNKKEKIVKLPIGDDWGKF